MSWNKFIVLELFIPISINVPKVGIKIGKCLDYVPQIFQITYELHGSPSTIFCSQINAVFHRHSMMGAVGDQDQETWALDGIPGTRAPGHRSPGPWSQGIFFIFFIFLVWRESFFSQKKQKKYCFLSVFSLFLSLFLSFSVHTL